MQPIRLFVKETDEISRCGEPVSRGIPLPCGAVSDIHQLQLASESGERVGNLQVTPLTRWHDGSLKWVRLDFPVSIKGNTHGEYLLTGNPDESAVSDSHPGDTYPGDTDPGDSYPDWVEGDEKVTLTHSGIKFSMLKATGEVIVYLPGTRNNSAFTIASLETAEITSVSQQEISIKLISAGPFRYELELTYKLRCSKQELSIVVLHRYILYPCSGLMRLEHCIHNPSAAEHRGGLWDLGDKNAFLLSDTGFSLDFSSGGVEQYSIQNGALKSPMKFAGTDCVDVYQESSGGENWNSENHVDRTGNVPITQKGYVITCNEEPIESSSRIEPIITLKVDDDTLNIVAADFWQNCPTELSYENNRMDVRLFTDSYPGVQELQPGEKKTRQINFLFSNSELNNVALLRPLNVSFHAEHWFQCAVTPFVERVNSAGFRNPLDDVLCDPASYHVARERIDEYGWRNFGEVVADHESLYSPDCMLVSHYNNQYDPIQGFALQFLYTGDSRWFKLFDELARHVVDIDIYDTSEDRTEYNNGLFWHTDHYLPAVTSTHRTFSRHNNTSSTAGQTGGGPGSEHCYSHGLLLHYHLTGNRASADSVLKLANWIVALHEDDSCLFANINLAYKRDVRRLLQLYRTGYCSRHIYPFTRGTGNYISCLLDAYELSNDSSWLHMVEEIVANTVHPSDDVDARKLMDIERNWSYTVLLLSISKYLWHKQSINQLDEKYEYAKASFLVYAQWILKNECTYLSQIEQLEFPNDTWVAQEIRKSNILAIAASLDPEKRPEYIKRSRYFLDYICEALSRSKQTEFARIQAILMQNYGPQYLIDKGKNGNLFNEASHAVKTDFSSQASVTRKELILSILKRILIGIGKFSLVKEINWLKRRVFS